jgi:hypothetical protein
MGTGVEMSGCHQHIPLRFETYFGRYDIVGASVLHSAHELHDLLIRQGRHVCILINDSRRGRRWRRTALRRRHVAVNIHIPRVRRVCRARCDVGSRLLVLL